MFTRFSLEILKKKLKKKNNNNTQGIVYATSWRYFPSRKSFLLMNGAWIHLNQKMVEILKDQTQKINTCSKTTVETPEQGAICSKLTITTVLRAIIWFCLEVD